MAGGGRGQGWGCWTRALCRAESRCSCLRHFYRLFFIDVVKVGGVDPELSVEQNAFVLACAVSIGFKLFFPPLFHRCSFFVMVIHGHSVEQKAVVLARMLARAVVLARMLSCTGDLSLYFYRCFSAKSPPRLSG